MRFVLSHERSGKNRAALLLDKQFSGEIRKTLTVESLARFEKYQPRWFSHVTHKRGTVTSWFGDCTNRKKNEEAVQGLGEPVASHTCRNRTNSCQASSILETSLRRRVSRCFVIAVAAFHPAQNKCRFRNPIRKMQLFLKIFERVRARSQFGYCVWSRNIPSLWMSRANQSEMQPITTKV